MERMEVALSEEDAEGLLTARDRDRYAAALPRSTKSRLLAAGIVALAVVGSTHLTRYARSSAATLLGAPGDARDVHSRLWSSSAKPSAHCLSANGEVRTLIHSADQIILAMPPKAAGTTLKGFAQSCNPDSYKKLMQNFLNHQGYLEHLLTYSYDMPGVLASHVYQAEGLLGILRNLPRNSLLIYSHRDETSRVISAIAHVAKKVCHERGFDGVCYFNEKELIDLIKSGRDEIHNSRVLTCEIYDSIAGFAPNMLFMDYRQSAQVMNLLAEKLCPDADEETQNAGDKSDPIRVQGAGFNVTVKEWLQSKKSDLELSLNLNNDTHAISCRGTTRRMEDRLFACPDGFLNARGIGT